jgi:hypothetical protein
MTPLDLLNDLPALHLLYMDAAVLLVTEYCFRRMAQGRKLLLGETQAQHEPAPSEVYRAAHDWRM